MVGEFSFFSQANRPISRLLILQIGDMEVRWCSEAIVFSFLR